MNDLARHWSMDPSIDYLNHGSFGATPIPVLDLQSELRQRMERQQVLFLDQELEHMLDEVRGRLGEFVGADPDDLAFVPNATTGVNTVLHALDLQPGDEILATDHDYNACLNAIGVVAARSGATRVIANVPFPITGPDVVVDAILERVTARTRLAVISHITSPTAVVFPIERIVAELNDRGVDTLVDGAHGPGMLPLNLDALGAAYYTGNCHKWMCTPKGSALLHVRRDRQAALRPAVISHGTNSPRRDRSRFRLEFDWGGTADPTPYLCIPAAIDFMAGLVPGGWPEIMRRNRDLAAQARSVLNGRLQQPEPAPESMLGATAAIGLPIDLPPAPTDQPEAPTADETWPLDPLHDVLWKDHRIEVPVYPWPHTPAVIRPRHRLLRVSAQLYNSIQQYERLADVLGESLRDAPQSRHGARG